MSTDKNNIFEVSVSYTQYCSIRVRAISEAEAIEFVEDNLHSGELNWRDGDAEYSISEVYKDGEDFDVNLITEKSKNPPSTGTVRFAIGPEDSVLIVTDSNGTKHTLNLKAQTKVAAGKCTWQLLVNDQVIKSGEYEIYKDEANPIIIR